MLMKFGSSPASQSWAKGPVRRGSLLILVVGLAALLAVTATAVLLRVQSDGRANQVVVQDAQCRLALTAAMHFLLESSRIGWHASEEAYGWVDIRDGQPGPRTLTNNTLPTSGWPALGSHFRGDLYAWEQPPYAMENRPVVAPVPWREGRIVVGEHLSTALAGGGRLKIEGGYHESQTNWLGYTDDTGRILAVRISPNKSSAIGRSGSVTITLFTDNEHTELLGSVSFMPSNLVMGEDLTITTHMPFSGAGRFYAQTIADDTREISIFVDVDYELDVEPFDADYDLFDSSAHADDFDPRDNPRLNRDLMRGFLERTPWADGAWKEEDMEHLRNIWAANMEQAYEAVARSRPAANDWSSFSAGNPRPRGESLGRGWFRIYRETAAESQADGFLPGSTFIITVGAGGTRGFRDWNEASSHPGNNPFPSQAVFNALRQAERLQWYRVRWVPQIGGGLESVWRQWPSEIVATSNNNRIDVNAYAGYTDGAANNPVWGENLRRRRIYDRLLTSLLTNLDPSAQHTDAFFSPRQGGSIDWVYRLAEEPRTPSGDLRW
ncbi:MAG: hypothetical protein EA401_09230 [Planctomycetota bacterium]|nr:MAG: hypothetical protein EA401_09230 [Planctomycetota bacterium]